VGQARIASQSQAHIHVQSKKDWLALLSTDTTLADEDIVRICGKRWDIENIFFMDYISLAYQCRMETDHCSFYDLFLRLLRRSRRHLLVRRRYTAF
jgi:hypothetical protein